MGSITLNSNADPEMPVGIYYKAQGHNAPKCQMVYILCNPVELTCLFAAWFLTDCHSTQDCYRSVPGECFRGYFQSINDIHNSSGDLVQMGNMELSVNAMLGNIALLIEVLLHLANSK